MIRYTLMNMFVVAVTAILLSACDAHIEFPDNTMKVGHILCTDGCVHPFDETEGKTPIAVVFYVNNSEDIEGKGYAVYLKDLCSAEYTDSLGIKQGTSADILAYDGNQNTYAMYSNPQTASPAAEAVFDMWRYGQSAYIGSVAEMKLLYENKEVVNLFIEKCGGTPLPDEPKECWYWSSTEVKGQETAKAWLFSLGSGSYQETPKDEPHKIRPIITINN